jgi:hypothetical protein
VKPTITVARTSKSKALDSRLRSLGKRSVYVGIPASSARDRGKTLLGMAGKFTGKKGGMSLHQLKRAAKLQKAASQDINNASLLFIFSKGSPLRRQPPRAVLEPAIEYPANRERISAELAAASRAALHGQQGEVTNRLKRAGMAGRDAAQGWFTNPANGWAQNAPSTIRRKLGKLAPGKRRKEALDVLSAVKGTMPSVGSNPDLDAINTVGIDTGAMYRAITYVMGTDEAPFDHEGVTNYQGSESPNDEQIHEAPDFVKRATDVIKQAGSSAGEDVGEAAEGAAEIL